MPTEKWNFKKFFPTDSNYVCRFIEESFVKSSKGNPMIVLQPEIVSPAEVNNGQETLNIAGTKPAKMYFNTKVLDEDGNIVQDKTDSAAKRIEQLYTALELDFTDFNPDNPTLAFKGKTFYCMIQCEEDAQRKNPTPDQIKKGERGDTMKNPVTGKDLITYKPVVREVFGLAQVGAGASY